MYSEINHSKQLPKIIMGCDALVDFLPGLKKISINEKLDLLGYAHALGITGIDVSVCSNFISAYRQLICSNREFLSFGNPNWKCGIKLEDKDLWDIQDRIRVTLLKRYFNSAELNSIYCLPKWSQKRWFLPKQEALALSFSEVSKIYLDKRQLKSNLEKLDNLVDIVLFGSDYLDWLAKLNRIDLIEEGIQVIKEMGFIPFSISHWPSVVAPIIEDLPYEGHWIHYNELERLIVPQLATDFIKKLQKPIIVFRVLSAGKLAHRKKEAIQFVVDQINPRSIVVGIGSKKHIKSLLDLYIIKSKSS
jgi:hypothetical protein